MNRFQLLMGGEGEESMIETRVVSVLSGKGGVGKSVTAFNIADQLRRRSRRVLLVDADLTCGNQHLLANVNAGFGIHQFIDGSLSLSQAVTSVGAGFDLLASSPGRKGAWATKTGSEERFVTQLRHQASRYDFVVIDHSSGVSEQSIAIASDSDDTLLIVIPELTSIADAYGLFKRLKETGTSGSCRLLVNRAASNTEAEYIRDKFCALAERFVESTPEWAGQIPEDDSLRLSVARQKPVAEVSSQSVATQAFAAIAAGLGVVKGQPSVKPLASINKNNETADNKGKTITWLAR